MKKARREALEKRAAVHDADPESSPVSLASWSIGSVAATFWPSRLRTPAASLATGGAAANGAGTLPVPALSYPFRVGG
jgi:hypothetical protein